jgi:hypothetical protein
MTVLKRGAGNQLKFSEAGRKPPNLKTSRRKNPYDFLWAQSLWRWVCLLCGLRTPNRVSRSLRNCRGAGAVVSKVHQSRNLFRASAGLEDAAGLFFCGRCYRNATQNVRRLSEFRLVPQRTAACRKMCKSVFLVKPYTRFSALEGLAHADARVGAAVSQDSGTHAIQAAGCSSPAVVSGSSPGPCCAGPVHAQCSEGEPDWLVLSLAPLRRLMQHSRSVI